MTQTSDEMPFCLHSTCIPVLGVRRSMICDLGSRKAHLIPNALHDILKEMPRRTLSDIKKAFDPSEYGILDEYFEFLIEEDYGFFGEVAEELPALSLHWDRPGKVTNAIIDIDELSNHDYPSILGQLDQLGCEALEIRTYCSMSIDELKIVMQLTDGWRFRHIDLIIKWHASYTVATLTHLILTHQTLSRITVHASPRAGRHRAVPFSSLILFTPQLFSVNSCGQVSPFYFTFMLEHFAEAQHFNTCLHKKLSIAADGRLCACPSMTHSFGNASVVPLKEVVNTPESVRIGNISKNQIEVCRDCEFRYVCTDCRAFTTHAAAKPAKCDYDPYTATWTGTKHGGDC